VLGIPPQAVELPHHEHIPRATRPEGIGENGTRQACPTGLLLINVDSLPDTFLSYYEIVV
jgi:hypothetical protein